MQLRDYQQECIEAINQSGAGRHLCCLATGLGKTVIFANIPRCGNTLILSHRQELVMQPMKYFDCDYGVEMGTSSASFQGLPACPVTSASIQTMTRRFKCYNPDAFHTIIVDEAHHAASESYRKVLDYFTPNRLIGFTATPNRSDGAGLESIFDQIIFKKDLRFGIENGFLSPIWCKKVNIGYDLRGVAVRMGDYAPRDLERAVNVDKCNDAIAEIVQNIAELPALIFAVDVAHAQAIADRIPGAVALSAVSKDRNEVVEAYKRGEVPVLVNCALFTEGTDLPNTRTVIIARPTKSVGLYTQMVGRGTRLAPEKDHCLLIDCVGASNMPLCTAPTLLGLDIDGVPAKYQVEIEGDLLADIPAIIEARTDTPESWINNVRVVDLWSKANGYTLHDINYQRRADGTLYLRLPIEGTRRSAMVSISAPDLRGEVVFSTSGGYSEQLPAQEAYDLTFRWLRKHFTGCRPLWSLTSAKRWGKAPANDKQIRYINQLAKRKKIDVSGVMENLTKLQATSLIERLK
jgi:hypothetical protein